MTKRLYLVGSDHFHHDYNWLLNLFREIQPDCITLEKKINESATLYWEFKHPLPQLLKEHKEGQHLEGEFAAGVHYARQYNPPVFCIDEFNPFEIALLTNMNSGENYEILRGDKHLPRKESNENWTRRNKFMALAINYHLHVSGYNKIVHIGGRGHYDGQRCVPLQDLVIADFIEIIDAVNRSRANYKQP